jgi:hypothetical protein
VNSSVIFPPFPFPAAGARDEDGAAYGGAGCCDAPIFLLASLRLMTKSTESNLLTMVKPWST